MGRKCVWQQWICFGKVPAWCLWHGNPWEGTEEKEEGEEEARHKVSWQVWASQRGSCSVFSVEKAFLPGFFTLTFWLLCTFPGFLKPQGRNVKDTHRALNDWCLRACVHVCVCVYVFMYVSRWTGRAYFLCEKPIGCAQNEVLNRMLSSSGEVRAAWSSGCCGSVRGCAERSVPSSAAMPRMGCGSERLQELPSISITVWWRGDTSPTTSRQWSRHCSASLLALRPEGCSGDTPRALVFA